MKTSRQLRFGPARRRGIASLEFVMCAVPLIFLAGMTATLGFCLLAKVSVAYHVRTEVWKLRDRTANGTDTETLSLYPSSEAGAILKPDRQQQTRRLPVLHGPFTAVSRDPVLLGSWDFREVSDFSNDGPHFGLLGRMANANVDGLNQFADLLKFSAGSALASQLNSQLDQKKNQMQQQVDDLKQQRDDWENQRNDAQKELDNLGILELWKAPYLEGKIQWLDAHIGPANDAISKAEKALSTLP